VPPELVDYERAAGCYDPGRTLSSGSVERWRDALRARLPGAPLRCVVDVGAGTGLFFAMWLELGAETIIAVEPSAAMRARASSRCGARVRLVAGTASGLGLANASADVLWLSAVIHHVRDLDAAALELRRVLRPGGRIFLRGYFPDTSEIPWLRWMPGAERAGARFPTTSQVAAVLGRAGFSSGDVVNVPEPERARANDAADWIARMRAADSILTALRDDEIERGIASLRELGDARLEPLSLTLVTATAA
jgi:SAM-dependent methyltransferase